MQLCARCKKRPAMVFITRLENEKSINEPMLLATLEDVVSAEIFKDILKESLWSCLSKNYKE